MTALAHDRQATNAQPAGPLSAGIRLSSIDMLRGLVIILMVLDHTRDYFLLNGFTTDATNPATSYPALYATRWITHLCAPSFVFLAGVSALLKGARDGDIKSLSWFLFSRGLWLIVLELTVIGFGWSFAVSTPFFQVIWAIGIGMMVLAALVWAGPRVILALGVAIIAGHNLLDPIDPPDLGQAAPVWNFVHQFGFPDIGGTTVFMAYPALPWFGIMCLGYGLGHLFLRPEGERIRTLLFLGLTFLVAFAVLRGINIYGDPSKWAVQADSVRTAMSFLNVSKYPPSLLYILATLGLAFLLLAAFERLRGPLAELFLTYGRVPLFVYVLHIYLLHLMQIAVGAATGFPPATFIDALANPQQMEGWGFNLAMVYVFWAVLLALLFPLARWFGKVKRERRDWWLSYL